MSKIFLQKAVQWFITIKAPDLKDKVNAGLTLIESGNPIEEKYRKIFGFILFDYSMHQGPLSFFDAEEAAEEIGVTEELKYYAKDWIDYSKKSKAVNINPTNQE